MNDHENCHVEPVEKKLDESILQPAEAAEYIRNGMPPVCIAGAKRIVQPGRRFAR